MAVDPEALDTRSRPEADRRDGPGGDADDGGAEAAAEMAKAQGWDEAAARSSRRPRSELGGRPQVCGNDGL